MNQCEIVFMLHANLLKVNMYVRLLSFLSRRIALIELILIYLCIEGGINLLRVA